MYNYLIGKRSDKVLNTVERGAVRKFVESVGDLHPIYVDPEYLKNSRYKNNIAPPTFPVVFDYGTIEGLNLTKAGLIHGEESYHYERGLHVGENIYCYMEVKNYNEKTGNSGTMGFLVISYNGEDTEGNIIFISTRVIIITEAVRKEMNI